jgi:hemolysin D
LDRAVLSETTTAHAGARSRQDRKTPLQIVERFQSETDTIRDDSESRWARSAVLILAAMFVSVIGVMCVTRLDRVVTSASGKIVSASGVNVLQALDPSIIKSIDVQEGDEVREGQLLATLDPTFAAADVKQLRGQVAGLEAQIARDKAQLSDQPLVMPDETDPELAKYAVIQRAYYEQQVAQYKAQVRSFDAKILQTESTVAKYETDSAHYQQREDIAHKIEEMRATLAAHGSGSQLNLYTSQDQRMEMDRTLEFDQNSLAEARHTLTSLKADRDAFIQQWSTQLSQDIVTAGANLDTARSQLEKAEKHEDLVRLTAAQASVVLTVAKVSVGSVLKQGDTLLTTMPADTPVEAEFRILSRDVGFIRAGDRCVMKVDAFNFMEHGTAAGTVRWISDNAFTTDDDGRPAEAYYKGRCGVDATHFTGVPQKFRLIPGMMLQADINVGTRSVAMYLLAGVFRIFKESMREP